MLTLYVVKEDPEHICFTKTENYEQVLKARDIDKEDVMSQEFSIEALIRLIDGGHRLFVVCLT